MENKILRDSNFILCGGSCMIQKPDIPNIEQYSEEDLKQLESNLVNKSNLKYENGKYYYEYPRDFYSSDLQVKFIAIAKFTVYIDEYGSTQDGWTLHADFNEDNMDLDKMICVSSDHLVGSCWRITQQNLGFNFYLRNPSYVVDNNPYKFVIVGKFGF